MSGCGVWIGTPISHPQNPSRELPAFQQPSRALFRLRMERGNRRSTGYIEFSTNAFCRNDRKQHFYDTKQAFTRCLSGVIVGLDY
jgi:hypothetical protein